MPTKLRRHAVTETPAVRAALDELRGELGTESVPLPELVILGAREKTARLRSQREDGAAARGRLADRVRSGDLGIDPEAANLVRRSGWAR